MVAAGLRVLGGGIGQQSPALVVALLRGGELRQGQRVRERGRRLAGQRGFQRSNSGLGPAHRRVLILGIGLFERVRSDAVGLRSGRGAGNVDLADALS